MISLWFALGGAALSVRAAALDAPAHVPMRMNAEPGPHRSPERTARTAVTRTSGGTERRRKVAPAARAGE